MTDSDVADYMTQLKFKLLKKKLENEYENSDDFEPPISAAKNCGGHDYALQSALRRQKDLLQQLRAQNLLEEFSLPRGLPRIQKKHFKPDNVYQTPCPFLPPTITEQPRIIQQTLPQQLPTVIQPISQHPPLIAQIPSPQLSPASRSGSIKEDMVEMMLMQNAQMHQIIMQNMMLKCLPPSAFSTASGHGPTTLPYGQQFSTVLVRPEKSRPSTVYHHHFTTSGIPAVPSQVGFPMWPTITQPGLGTQLGRYPSDVHNVPIPVTASHRYIGKSVVAATGAAGAAATTATKVTLLEGDRLQAAVNSVFIYLEQGPLNSRLSLTILPLTSSPSTAMSCCC